MFLFLKYNLARQFLISSLIILVSGMIIIGSFINSQIEAAVINQTSAITALYVDSFVSPILQSLIDNSSLDENSVATLNTLIQDTHLGQNIVAFKIWTPDGLIVYSPNTELIGQQFEFDADFKQALSGQVVSSISVLDQPEHEFERQFWNELIETYAPVWAENTGELIAITEFYQLPDNLRSEIRSAQKLGWLILGLSTLLMYIFLVGIFGKAGNTILLQQKELNTKVTQLTELLNNNQLLHTKLQHAAIRTISLNEKIYHRISADLHDGPIQDIALSLLHIESIADACKHCQAVLNSSGLPVSDRIGIMKSSLESSIREIRMIAAGLRLPEIDNLSIKDLTFRAIHEYQKKTNKSVNVVIEGEISYASSQTKITFYRVLHEALMNGFRHANGLKQVVNLWEDQDTLHVFVSDGGSGFNIREETDKEGRNLGIIGMRERVELLGGSFDITSGQHGTNVHFLLPLWASKEEKGPDLQ